MHTAWSKLLTSYQSEDPKFAISTHRKKEENGKQEKTKGSGQLRPIKKHWPDRKSTRLNSSHSAKSRMPSSA